MGANVQSLYAKGARIVDVSADVDYPATGDQPIAFRAVGAGTVKVKGLDGIAVSHPVLDGERVSLPISYFYSTSNGSSGITSLVVYF